MLLGGCQHSHSLTAPLGLACFSSFGVILHVMSLNESSWAAMVTGTTRLRPAPCACVEVQGTEGSLTYGRATPRHTAGWHP